MCNYKCWFQNDGGYIVQCLGCGQLQISFGTSMFCVDETEYNNLYEQIKTAYAVYANDTISRSLKHIIIHTQYTDVKVIFSITELIELYTMFEQADVEKQTYNLLQLFNL